jgi:phosphoserine phosphatase
VSVPTKYTGLLIASGVHSGDPTKIVLETLAPFSLAFLSSEINYVRDRFIYTALVEMSPDHTEALGEDLDRVSSEGAIDIAYEFTAFALPPANQTLTAYEFVATSGSFTPSQLLDIHEVVAGEATVTSHKLELENSYTILRYGLLLPETNAANLASKITELSRSTGIGVTLRSRNSSNVGSDVILFDMDSTFINEEVIDQLADLAGLGEKVAAITERAMQGELDFATSLKERVKLLAGQPESLLKDVLARLSLTPGAADFVVAAQARGAKVGIVSGGFHDVIDQFLEPLHLDLVIANRFEIINGHFTGEVIGEIVDRGVKARTLEEFAAGARRSISVGDGANDISMIEAADIGIAFCAKPSLVDVADLALNHRDLRALLPLLGF